MGTLPLLSALPKGEKPYAWVRRKMGPLYFNEKVLAEKPVLGATASAFDHSAEVESQLSHSHRWESYVKTWN
jgi:hypothetical protein